MTSRQVDRQTDRQTAEEDLSCLPVRPRLCLFVRLSTCVCHCCNVPIRRQSINLSCMCCLTYCAKADCLSRRLVALAACHMRQLTLPTALLLSAVPPPPSSYVGVCFSCTSHRQSKAKQKQTQGGGGSGGLWCGFVPLTRHREQRQRETTPKGPARSRQPRARQSWPTNRPPNLPPPTQQTHQRTGPSVCSLQPIPTGPACQNLGFLRS